MAVCDLVASAARTGCRRRTATRVQIILLAWREGRTPAVDELRGESRLCMEAPRNEPHPLLRRLLARPAHSLWRSSPRRVGAKANHIGKPQPEPRQLAGIARRNPELRARVSDPPELLQMPCRTRKWAATSPEGVRTSSLKVRVPSSVSPQEVMTTSPWKGRPWRQPWRIAGLCRKLAPGDQLGLLV
jgi:hypothetical protein